MTPFEVAPIDVVNASIAGALLVATALMVVTGAQQYGSMRQQTVSIFLEISDRWTAIYAARNAILQSPPVSVEDLEARFGGNYSDLLKSEEWKNVRAVCNFFEIAGYLLRSKYIRAETLFMLVSVDASESMDKRTPQSGAVYARLRGYIEYLRRVYHDRIYDNYDHYLLPEYWKYIKSKRGGSLARKRSASKPSAAQTALAAAQTP